MRIYETADEIIGSTPLLTLSGIQRAKGLKSRILAKLEYLNPHGSVKDRAALYIINQAEKDGKITRGSTIIEATSGNTGIGLAAVGAARGYRTVIVMPDTMSRERIDLMRAYGAEVVLTDGALGMAGAIAKAEEIHENTIGSFIADQFNNDANRLAHFETTGPELYEDTDGKIDVFVAGVGTGGTLSGVGEYLKERNSNIKVVAVEPKSSAVLSGKEKGAHGLQGIGAGFIPQILDTGIIDEIVTVTESEAYSAARELARIEGILVGVSSGAALAAAVKLSERKEFYGKTIAVILPDGGEKYMSCGLFNEE